MRDSINSEENSENSKTEIAIMIANNTDHN